MSTTLSPKDIAEGESLEFKSKVEDWNVYKLDDGSILKIKLILTKVIRTKKHNPDGSPIYFTVASNVLSVNSPKKLWGPPRTE